MTTGQITSEKFAATFTLDPISFFFFPLFNTGRLTIRLRSRVHRFGELRGMTSHNGSLRRPPMKNDFFDNVLAAVMFLLLLLLLFPLLPFFLIALLLAGAPAHTINQ